MGRSLQKCVGINNIVSIFSLAVVCLTLIVSVVLSQTSISLIDAIVINYLTSSFGAFFVAVCITAFSVGICVKYVKTRILEITMR